MKLGKMLSVGEVVEDITEQAATQETPVAPAPEAVTARPAAPAPVAERESTRTPVATSADR